MYPKLAEKTCSKCKVLKSVDSFHLYKTGKRIGKVWSECKQCRKERLYEWRKNNPEKYKENCKRGYLKYRYNLSEGDLKSTLIKQKDSCAICKSKKKLVVDHCHASGFVRELLCYNCNTLLGHIENDEKMRDVLQYLDKHKSPSFLLRLGSEDDT